MKSASGFRIFITGGLLFMSCVAQASEPIPIAGVGELPVQPSGRAQKSSHLAAESPLETTKAMEQRLASVGGKGLAGLLNDPDISIALQAAWELALGPNTDKEVPRPENFLRFLKSRCRVNLPAVWEYDLVMGSYCGSPNWSGLRAAAHRRYLPTYFSVLVFQATKMELSWAGYFKQRLTETEYGMEAPVGTSIKKEDD